MECIRVVIEGRVQGVGFRYHTCAEARALGLNGWVCNRPDGRVEAEFEGSEDAVQSMLAWCQRGPAMARVSRVVTVSRIAVDTPSYEDFHMRSD